MDIKQISPFLSVTAQISVSDIGIIATQGFRTIINNRPDDESGKHEIKKNGHENQRG